MNCNGCMHNRYRHCDKEHWSAGPKAHRFYLDQLRAEIPHRCGDHQLSDTAIVLQCLRESGPLTLDALVFESDLDESTVADCLERLQREDRVHYYKGAYRLFNKKLSDRVRIGKLVKSIPALGGE